MALYVGTSGWSYPEWRATKNKPSRPAFYPEGLPPSRFLGHYAEVLSACEINATFYRVQTRRTVAAWADSTPPRFRFAAKAHRVPTPSASVAPRGFVHTFLTDYLDSLTALQSRLGAVFLQFPPHRSRDDAGVFELLTVLGKSVPFAAEFRHDSWNVPEVGDALAALGGTLCVSDMGGAVPAAMPPGRIAYLRLRADRYGPEARGEWRDLVMAEALRREVFVFTKHRAVAPRDPRGGLGLALWLQAAG